MKIVFMGTPDYAAHALECLIEAGHEIALVITNPDKPAGRGGRIAMSEVKQTALAHDLEVFQPVKIRADEAAARLESVQADVGVVAAFGQILTERNLSAPRLGCVNLHASLLPAYRGSSPIQQAILDGIDVTGVTTMQMDAGIDTGDILLQQKCSIDADETAGSLFDKLTRIGGELIVKTLNELEAGRITPVRQDETLATKTAKIGKEQGHIDWARDAVYIERLIRAMSPWPSAYSKLPEGGMLKIWRAHPVEEAPAGRPGEIVEITKDALIIRCGTGALCVEEVQAEGRKRMRVHDFLLGAKPETGSVLQ